MTSHVVIAGGSLGGLHTAEALRVQGYRGRITIIDAHPEPYYDRPPLSKEYLNGTKSADRIVLRPAGQRAALDARWRLGVAATSLDVAAHELTTGDGEVLAYSSLVIATGVAPAWPAALRVPGAMTLRTKQDADRLRARLGAGIRLVVIGAGFLGLEVAATFTAGGADVHVVEMARTPLLRQLGADVGLAVQRLHQRRGVTFHLGTQAAGVTASGGRTRVELSNGTVLESHVLLVAVGSVPAVGWLAGSGLTLDDGVLCDATLHAAPDVFAVGDVARWPHPLAGRPVRIEHWTNAVEQAAHVARQVAQAGAGTAPFAAVPYFWSDQYDGRLQAHGFPGAGDEIEVVDGDLGSERFVVHYRRAGRMTAVVGRARPRQVLAGRRDLVTDLEQEREERSCLTASMPR